MDGPRLLNGTCFMLQLRVFSFSSRDSPRTLSSILSGEGLYEVERGGSQARNFSPCPPQGLTNTFLLQLLYQSVGRNFCATNSLAKLGCDLSMATQAECANVVQVTLPAPLRDRQNVIRVPKTLASPGVESPMLHQGHAGSAACSLELVLLRDSVNSTVSAHALIAVQYLLAQVPGLRAQLPLVYAVV